MKAFLCQIDGWNGTNAAIVRVCSHDDERVCHLNDVRWLPAIATLPTLRYDFFDGDFSGQITAPTGELKISLAPLPGLANLSLHDARIRIWWGELGDAYGSYSLLFDGRVKEQPDITDGMASFAFGCDDAWLDEPLLATFAGTGAAGDPAELKGNAKQLLFGAPRFVTGLLVDPADNTYLLSNGQIEDFEVAFDQLTRFGAATADYTTLAALKAASIPSGGWATCKAAGWARFGAKPEGLVTFHMKGDKAAGWARKPGSIIRRVAELKGKLARVNGASLDALDIACPWNLSRAILSQTTAREIIQSIALSVNAVPIMDWLGNLWVLPVAIGTPAGTLAADGSALPPVADVALKAIAPPWWRLAQKVAVTQRVHSASEIAFGATIVPTGLYSPVKVYREGNIVETADKATWIYINAVPSSGHAPPPYPVLTDAWWQNMTPPSESLSKPGANALFNGGLSLGWNGWSSGPLVLSQDWRGNIAESPYFTGGEFVAESTIPINALNGVPLCLSAVFTNSNASPHQYIFCDIRWANGGNGAHIGYSSFLDGNNCITRDELASRKTAYQPMHAPAATDGSVFVRGYVRIVVASDVAYAPGTRFVQQIKVESGLEPTPFSDDATNGAIWENVSGADHIESGAGKANNGINPDGSIKDDKVDTPAIVDGAVNDARNIADFTGASATNFPLSPPSYRTVGSITVTLENAGDRVALFCSGVLSVSASATSGSISRVYGDLRLVRAGGPVIWGIRVIDGAGDSHAGNFSPIDMDMPGAGTFTYTLEVRVDQTGGSGTVRGSFNMLNSTLFPIIFRSIAP